MFIGVGGGAFSRFLNQTRKSNFTTTKVGQADKQSLINKGLSFIASLAVWVSKEDNTLHSLATHQAHRCNLDYADNFLLLHTCTTGLTGHHLQQL